MTSPRFVLRSLPERLIALLVLAALLWPLVYAFWMSFTPKELLEPPHAEWSLRWYREFFARSRWTEGLLNSLLAGLGAAALSVITGGSVAVALVRYHFRGRKILEKCILLPLFVPAVVLGIALLPTMRALGIWGTLFSISAAHTLWGMPLVYLAVRNALEAVDENLELAARGLGASAASTFLLVTLPIILPAVAIGALMAFIVSLNELVMAIFLCTPTIDTLPKVIWPNLRYTLSPLVAAASSITVLVTLFLLSLASLLRPKWRA